MSREPRPLAQGYTYEVDATSEHEWGELLRSFADGNIYQTLQYATVMGGAKNLSHIVLKKDGEVVALALARVKILPVFRAGIAYVYHGPVFNRLLSDVNCEHFRQAMRALRNEFVCRRHLTLRTFPALYEDDNLCFTEILNEEGFSLAVHEARERTVLMDLTPPIEELRQGVARNWRRNLKQAEQFELEVIEGTGEDMVDEFVRIYAQMVSRKDFHSSDTVTVFKRLQAALPAEFKMMILKCSYDGQTSAMLGSSAIGGLAIDMYAATSVAGMQNRASYLLRWMLIEKLKQLGITRYDLNGVNPATNPGTHRFKRDLAGKFGRDVYYLGKFDASPGGVRATTIAYADSLRRSVKKLVRALIKKVRSKPAPPVQSTQTRTTEAGATQE